MAYPTSLDNFPSVIADGTSVVSEAHAVTSGSSTFTLGLNKPTGWQVIPKGAFPLPAPGGATLAGLVGGSLTTTGVYKYVVTLGTQYGETVAGTEVTITLSGGQNATTLTAIPTGGTSTNPVLYRKIYRTASGGAAGTEKLVGFLDDNTATTFIDTLADADLPSITPPGSNGSGLQLVTIPGFAEVVSAPAAGQFSVDYSYTATGGTVTINSATTQTVNVSYTGGHLVNAALFNSLTTAINSLESHAVQLSPASAQAGTINVSGAAQAASFAVAGTGHIFDATHFIITDGGSHSFQVTTAGALTMNGTATISGITNIGANTGGVGQLAVGTGNLEILALQNTGAGGTNWTFAVGNTSLAPNEMFISRQVSGSVNGIGGGADEALLGFQHDNGANRKVFITNRAGTPLTIFDAISGAVTTGGALTVSAGGAAITGNSSISGTLDTSNPAVQATTSAAFSVPNSTVTTIPLNTTTFDTQGSQHSATVNTSRLTCQVAGRYQITANISMTAATAGTRRQVGIRLNSANWIALSELSPAAATGGQQSFSVSQLWTLAVNDYVEIGVYQDSGSSLAVSVGIGLGPWFSMVRIG